MPSGEAVYPGAPGAFSGEACRQLAPELARRAVPTFEDVAGQLADDRAVAGILPLENSTAGPVPGIAALIDRYELTIEHRLRLPIRLHLLALPGAVLGAIKLVRSHPMALRQCAKSLAALGVEIEEAANTALAARDLADSGRSDVAVVASAEAAVAYRLEVLASGIEDCADNATEFGKLIRSPR